MTSFPILTEPALSNDLGIDKMHIKKTVPAAA